MRRTPLFLLLVIAFNAAGQDVSLTREERAAESNLRASFGLKAVPLLEYPYRLPFSNRSLIVPQAWLREAIGDKRTEIAADSLRKDLPLLQAVMAKNYAGWRIAARRGWNWAQWFENWDRLLVRRSEQNLSLAEAMQPFAELQDFQADNSSGPVADVYFGSGSQSATLKTAPNGVCSAMRMRSARIFPMDAKDPGQQPRKALLPDLVTAVWYLSYPSKRGYVSAVRCGGKWIDADPVWEPRSARRESSIREFSQTGRDVPAFRVLTSRISYLRAPTGDTLNQKRMRQLIATLPASAGREELLIWDLRSHGGGDSYAVALKRWLDPVKVEKFTVSRTLRRSCLTAALQWNAEWFGISGMRPPTSSDLEIRLQGLADSVGKVTSPGCPATIETEKADWNYSMHTLPTQARFLVLVDSRCGGDCESMVNILAAEPGTVVAGVNTYGTSQYILPGYFVLPNSRLAFRTALGVTNIYGDNRSVDGYGLHVDVLLRTMEDQSPAGILKLAEALLARAN